MKFIALHWSAATRLFFAAAMTIAVGAAGTVGAATAPRYGGTLVVELREQALILDPVKWKPGAADNAASMQIAAAVFDRLVTLDRFGRFHPGLATDWSHDAAARRWVFTLRPAVLFSDGSPLTAADVAGALQELLLARATVSSTATHLVLQFPVGEPDLLEQLASGRYFIYRRNADGTLAGTGAFFVAEVTEAPGGTGISRYRLLSSEHCWAGRPFVDSLEVDLGVPALRQLFDLQLGKADVVEISPELVRRAGQENLRVWTSVPVLLYALQVSGDGGRSEEKPQNQFVGFESARTAQKENVRVLPEKPSLGEALSLALDRATMANVLLQKQAEPAGSFLPQWLSGYAFVFGTESDVAHAKVMSSALFTAPVATNAPGAAAQPLRLRVDAGGDLAKLIAERVAINARQAGIAVQVQTRAAMHDMGRDVSPARDASSASTEPSGLRLIAWRYSSLSERAELDSMVAALQLEPAADDKAFEGTEQLYARERRLLAERNLIPLVVMPEYIGLSPAVRDWMPEHWGEWHLADVWLDGKRNSSSAAGTQQ